MSKSTAKRGADQSYGTLPFPHPMSTPEGHIVWPFGRNAFPLFSAKMDFKQKWVEVCDCDAVKALQCMGFFGFYSKTKFMTNDPKNNCRGSQSEETSHKFENTNDTQINSRYSDGKYVLVPTSVPNALTQDNEQTSSQSLPSDPQYSDKSTGDSNLKLSFLEAFFISYVFGSLNVLNPETNQNMTLEQMWDIFGRHYSEDKLLFAVHYSAYHYLRSKGWVVRNGHTFGTNFLLYKEGPHLNHAQYSVLVRYAIDNSYDKPLNWYHISALIRLSKNVRKTLLICIVNVPKNIDYSSPKCIKDFEVELLSFDRWNPSKKDE